MHFKLTSPRWDEPVYLSYVTSSPRHEDAVDWLTWLSDRRTMDPPQRLEDLGVVSRPWPDYPRWRGGVQAVSLYVGEGQGVPDDGRVAVLAVGEDAHGEPVDITVSRWDGRKSEFSDRVVYADTWRAVDDLQDAAQAAGVNADIIDWESVGHKYVRKNRMLDQDLRIFGIDDFIGRFVAGGYKEYLRPQLSSRELVARRTALGMSQSQFADRLGVRQVRLSDMEAGKRPVPLGFGAELERLEEERSDRVFGFLHSILEQGVTELRVGDDPLGQSAASEALSKARQVGRQVRIID